RTSRVLDRVRTKSGFGCRPNKVGFWIESEQSRVLDRVRTKSGFGCRPNKVGF
ncbi:hypothetical protein KSS87_022090, partial [Heliosperma pusillum]